MVRFTARLVAPGITAWTVAIITTIFSSLTFYVPYYLATANGTRNKSATFIIAGIVFTILVSFFETLLELVTYRLKPQFYWRRKAF